MLESRAREASMDSDNRYRGKVLIVDDEPNIIKAIKRLLHKEGLELLSAETGAQALSILENTLIDVMLLDVMLPDINGLDVLRHAKQIDPETVVVMMTGHGTIKSAVAAMKAGAFEYLTKPFEDNDLIPLTIRRAVSYKNLKEENQKLQGMISGQCQFSNMIGVSAPMQRITRLAQRLADLESTVLITGESGTGKEVLARNIHFSGNRRQRPFVPIDCGAIPPGIIESELFGHLKGSFTGASQSSAGLLKMADKGTAFFDEIGDLPLEMQTRLLRFLQEREVRPVGGTTVDAMDIRIIAATNQNLEQMVAEKKFREDLYYRLNVVNIEISPLRERQEDIPALTKHLMDKHGAKYNRKLSISPEAFEQLLQFSWPGNVRQLENVIIQMLSLSVNEVIQPEDLPRFIRSLAPVQTTPVSDDMPLSLEEYERLCVKRALTQCKGNIMEAAKILNLGKSTMYRKIKDLNINVKSIS
jgi:DNA-binding NtrC family response regulator